MVFTSLGNHFSGGFQCQRMWNMCALTGKYSIYQKSNGQIATVQWRESDTLMPGQHGCRWGQEKTAECSRRGDVSEMLQERSAAGGKVMASECSTVRDYPPRVSLQPCRAIRVRECGISDSGDQWGCAIFIWNITQGYFPKDNMEGKYCALYCSFTCKWNVEYHKLW